MAKDEIRIDPEFHALIPPMSADERQQLEDNLKSDGCRDPLVAWNGILLDGHTRQPICERLGIGYRVVEVDLPDRDAAKAWVIRNQLGRRNINGFVRAELALMLKPLLSAKALEREKRGRSNPPQNSAEGRQQQETREVIAEVAGVSRDIIGKVENVQAMAIEPVKDMARAGDVSVDAAAIVASLPKKEQEKAAASGPKGVKAAAKKARDAKKKPVAATSNPEPAADPEPTPTDEVGTPLPGDAEILAAFATRPAFKDLYNRVSAIKSESRKLAALPGGEYLRSEIQQIDSWLDNTYSRLKRRAPHALCPYCHNKKAKCTADGCMGLGWVSKFTYDNTADALKPRGGKGAA